jgi:transmembrane 9 superfamily protein 2/4
MRTLLPLDYYALPFCAPQGGPKLDRQNLGENLAGDRIQTSPYYLPMKMERYCEQLCVSDLGPSRKNELTEAIQKNYHQNWLVDYLPAASKVEDDIRITTRYWQGPPIGFMSRDPSSGIQNQAFVFNHVNIEITYHAVDTELDKYRVVCVTAEPFSIKHKFEELDRHLEELRKKTYMNDMRSYSPKVANITNPIESCAGNNVQRRVHTNFDMATASGVERQLAEGKVLFTYDVIWTENSALDWSSRWDIYLQMDHAIPAKVHWYSLANSAVVCVVLLAILLSGLVFCLRKERNMYNSLETDEECSEYVEQHGWIAIRGNVFRPPSFLPSVFAVICGTGAQLMCTTSLIVIFSAVGFMSADRRGHFLVGALVTFASMGTVAGYVSARLCKTFKSTSWWRAATLTAFGFPGLSFGVFFLVNMIERAHESTKAISVSNFLTLVLLWLCGEVPLVFLGASVGFKCDPIEFPFEPVGDEARRLPPRRPWYKRVLIFLARAILFDIIPFGAVFVELYFILASAWMGFYYNTFGFMLFTLFITIVSCAFTSVVITYFRLRREDYRWWWSSLTTAGAIGLYIFLYSIFYSRKELEMMTSLVGHSIFFLYMALVSLGIAFMFGFVGVMANIWFTKRMYSTLQRDRPNLAEPQTELTDSLSK